MGITFPLYLVQPNFMVRKRMSGKTWLEQHPTGWINRYNVYKFCILSVLANDSCVCWDFASLAQAMFSISIWIALWSLLNCWCVPCCFNFFLLSFISAHFIDMRNGQCNILVYEDSFESVWARTGLTAIHHHFQRVKIQSKIYCFPVQSHSAKFNFIFVSQTCIFVCHVFIISSECYLRLFQKLRLCWYQWMCLK